MGNLHWERADKWTFPANGVAMRLIKSYIFKMPLKYKKNCNAHKYRKNYF